MMKKKFKAVNKRQALKEFENGKYIAFQPVGGITVTFNKKIYRQNQQDVEETVSKLKRGIWWVQE